MEHPFTTRLLDAPAGLTGRRLLVCEISATRSVQ
jgi:hypothetical protein